MRTWRVSGGQIREKTGVTYIMNTMPKFTRIEMRTSIHHRASVNCAQPHPHGAQTKATIFCGRQRVSVMGRKGTHNDGNQAHRQSSPEHAAHQVLDGGSEEPLESDIPRDVPDREEDEDEDIEDEDDYAEALQPSGIVGQIIQQDRGDSCALESRSTLPQS